MALWIRRQAQLILGDALLTHQDPSNRSIHICALVSQCTEQTYKYFAAKFYLGCS